MSAVLLPAVKQNLLLSALAAVPAPVLAVKLPLVSVLAALAAAAAPLLFFFHHSSNVLLSYSLRKLLSQNRPSPQMSLEEKYPEPLILPSSESYLIIPAVLPVLPVVQ